MSYDMLCERTTGEPAKAPLDNHCSEPAAPLFLNGAHARGIPIINETGE